MTNGMDNVVIARLGEPTLGTLTIATDVDLNLPTIVPIISESREAIGHASHIRIKDHKLLATITLAAHCYVPSVYEYHPEFGRDSDFRATRDLDGTPIGLELFKGSLRSLYAVVPEPYVKD